MSIIDETNVASVYGLIPNVNDATTRELNTQKLFDCINQYGEIVLDDTYYFKRISGLRLTNRSLKIRGIKNAKIMMTDGGELFKVSSSVNEISIDNIAIENSSSVSGLIVFSFPLSLVERVHINTMIITNCNFIGRVRLASWTNGNTDFVLDDIGIDNFIFRNNRARDISMSFCVLESCPVRKIFIENNSIVNFDYTFFNFGTQNDDENVPPGTETLLKLQREYCLVKNNVIMTTDDWWGNATSYYCFVLYEGITCVYDSNHIEGLKSNFTSSLYDAYLSCANLRYTNNVWKNNISFSPNQVCELMKAKGGTDTIEITRLYMNNRYILEAEFAEKYGKSLDLLHIMLQELVQSVKSNIIKNNIFDIYDLRFSQSGKQIKEIIFQNNIVNVFKTSGRFAASGSNEANVIIDNNIINIADIDSPLTFYRGRANSITISNNILNSPSMIGLYSSISNDTIIDSLTIQGNKLKTGSNFLIGGNYGGTIINNFKFIDNIIEFIRDGSTPDYILYDTTTAEFKNTYYKDNLFIHPFDLYEPRTRYTENGTKYEELKLLRLHTSEYANNGLALSSNITNTAKKKYRRTYTFEDKRGEFGFYYDFWIYREDDIPKVEFLDENLNVRTIQIGVSDAENRPYVKLNTFGDYTNKYKVRFYTSYFYIANFNVDAVNYGYVTIKTVSI